MPERIAHALMLTDVEREHLFLLARGQPPKARYRPAESVSPRIQRVLDALEFSPAFVKTATWDLVAWNHAALAVFDFGRLAPGDGNILRRIFRDPRSRAAQPDWESVARFAVATFRADATRAGAAKNVAAPADELCATSPDFARIWRDNDVRAHGEGTKQLHHARAGLLAMEYSAFVVDGRPDLSMVIYNPATPADVERVRTLLQLRHETAS